MARASKKTSRAVAEKFAAQNRKARRDYVIEESVEAGLMLTGSEVKGLRGGGASLNDSYAREIAGELWLMNAHIPEYKFANVDSHETKQRRKLLLHRREVSRLIGGIQRDGMTLVPLSIYFNDRGIAKVELGIAKGKKQHDKRATDKDRDWQRDQGRIMRDKG